MIVEIGQTFKNWGNESLKEIFLRFKKRVKQVAKNLKNKWKEILSSSLEAGIMAFISNIVVFCINLFATTLKRFVSVIRAGFVSLLQAIKMVVSPPKDMSKEEAYYQALKIITAGFIGALSLGLSDVIEKMLYSIPILQTLMLIPIPFLNPSESGKVETIGSAMSVTLSAIFGGILTTICLHLMDQYRNSRIKEKFKLRLVAHSGVLVNCSIAQSWFFLQDAQELKKHTIVQASNRLVQTKENLEASADGVQNEIDKMFNEIEEYKKGNV